MKYNIYYQSYTLCQLQAGVSDYFSVIKEEVSGVYTMAQEYGRHLFCQLNERIACVVCDESDIVMDYFQVNCEGVLHSAKADEYFIGGKATLENGRFYIDR